MGDAEISGGVLKSWGRESGEEIRDAVGFESTLSTVDFKACVEQLVNSSKGEVNRADLGAFIELIIIIIIF